jgi:hypothetical protein
MSGKTTIEVLHRLGRPVFTTREIALLRKASLSSASQTLSRLAEKAVVQRVVPGVWRLPHEAAFSPFAVVPYLTLGNRAYISFLSALHLHGIIEQIPQVIYAATTGHSRTIRTPVGTYSFHTIHPRFFSGFDWYGPRRDFLIAQPEKALVDSLYVSSRKGRQFGSFPELCFPKSFSFRRAFGWVERIPDKRIRGHVRRKLEILQAAAKNGGEKAGRRPGPTSDV